MDIGVISVRYARALIDYVCDEGVEDTLYQEFTRLSWSFYKFPELRFTLDNPILDTESKFNLICIAANGEEKSSSAFMRFIHLVLKQHREFYLHFIVYAFLEFYRKRKNIASGTLITAVSIDEETREKIRKTAGAQVHAHMELDTIVDPAIEGGFIFDINGYRLDASVAGQLKKVKQQFIDKNKRIV
ncbi:F0F1 ATP synthase subunit delta [Bacteroides sp. 519]|uniref:F0F1 ATP synthase subunit delta n=1 Tax=Bacteroides sp. 519 TaxID=2302937 RepID=UPI0013D3F86B|nr:F0F1 ATP synthase subunit delta [Bacteroides sp. 519]NDV60144.1 F0F1 ATP synthase subunit delta [Bacteroides sp. 519]